MKFGKKSKLMAAAIGLLALSAAGSVTGTVAWFTASNTVQATGMYVQADKEDGIVMANESFAKWATSVEASHDGKISSEQAKFIPTSTNDASKWAHASASDQHDELAINDSYEIINPTVNGETGIYRVSIGGSDLKNVYLLNTFYLKSANTASLEGNLYAKVTATATHADDLNKALRVLVKHGDDELIFAPIEGATLSYNVATAVTPATQDNPATPENEYVPAQVTKTATTAYYNVVEQLSSVVTIPANNPSSPNINTFPVNVYAYFEGEDENCYSDNITTTLADMSIVVKLGTTENL